MASLNKVLLIGNLTKDPEVRQTPGGQSVCKIRMASTRRFKSQAGDMREDTTFVDVTVWGVRGDNLARFFKKGDPIFIDGRLTLEEWQDKQSGEKRSKLSVTAEDWQFVAAKGEGGSRGESGGRSMGGSRESGGYGGGSSAPAAGSHEDEGALEGSGDVPF
ncbi:MAG TPA: single-stranded DNA-binding protein [Planctomycetota bacterium]|nr:single-stranded DNA-binding protein [Planctomycetota bacterium]